MNKISFKFLIMLLLTFIACSNSDESSEIDNSKPSNLSITGEIIGTDINNPNGDGNGVVDFNITATNATSYKVLINNEVLDLTKNVFSYTFTKNGTNEYQIIVSAYNSNGFISTTYNIKVYVNNGLELIWQDEFDQNGTPDPSKWGYNIGNGDNGWGNGESQYYTDRPENVIVENGLLKIITKKEDFSGFGYTSARMLTANKFDFTYGRIDVRAKLPAGGGVWPAIWLLGANIGSVGWPACGEIDIMEYTGNTPGRIQSALHTTSSSGNTVNHKGISIQNETTEFHLYSMIWTADSIVFMLDEQEYYTYNPEIKNDATWPYYRDQFIILNVAMGGALGGEISPDFDTSIMEIDYVRVYQ